MRVDIYEIDDISERDLELLKEQGIKMEDGIYVAFVSATFDSLFQNVDSNSICSKITSCDGTKVKPVLYSIKSILTPVYTSTWYKCCFKNKNGFIGVSYLIRRDVKDIIPQSL